jgi:protein SCO1/2
MSFQRHQLMRLRLVAIAAVPILLVACGGSADLTGTDLGKVPAPDFTLTDYRGGSVRLSDFRGRAVVLTFIYTNCPDACPLTAENLRLAYERLSAKTRAKVALITVTVDPERDTPEALRAFSIEHRLDSNPSWYALRGDRDSLEQVWASYAVDPGSIVPHREPGLVDPAGSADALDVLAHTDAVFVIDPDGRERVLMRSNLDPADHARNLTTLAG